MECDDNFKKEIEDFKMNPHSATKVVTLLDRNVDPVHLERLHLEENLGKCQKCQELEEVVARLNEEKSVLNNRVKLAEERRDRIFTENLKMTNEKNNSISELNEKIKELKNKNLESERLAEVLREKCMFLDTKIAKMEQELEDFRQRKSEAGQDVEELKLANKIITELKRDKLESDEEAELFESRISKFGTSEVGLNLDPQGLRVEKENSSRNVDAEVVAVDALSPSNGSSDDGLSKKGAKNSVKPRTREVIENAHKGKTSLGKQSCPNPPQEENNEPKEPLGSGGMQLLSPSQKTSSSSLAAAGNIIDIIDCDDEINPDGVSLLSNKDILDTMVAKNKANLVPTPMSSETSKRNRTGCGESLLTVKRKRYMCPVKVGLNLDSQGLKVTKESIARHVDAEVTVVDAISPSNGSSDNGLSNKGSRNSVKRRTREGIDNAHKVRTSPGKQSGHNPPQEENNEPKEPLVSGDSRRLERHSSDWKVTPLNQERIHEIFKMVRGRGVSRGSKSRHVSHLIDKNESNNPTSMDEIVSPTVTRTPQALAEPKVEVHLIGDILHSDQVHVATELRHIIESRLHFLGHTYAAMPSSHVQTWWFEFQRRFRWDESVFSTTAIRRAFESALRRRYSSRTNEWRQLWASSRKRPRCVPEDYWAAWLKEWEKPKFKLKAAKYKQNRLSEPEGDGTGMSKHIGGSRSTIDHAIDFRKKTGREPTKYEIFNRLHHKPDDSFTTRNAEKTAVEIERLMEDIRSHTQSEPDVDEVYTTVVQQKKNKYFGTGCFGKATQKGGSLSSSSQFTRDQLREEMRQEMERLKAAMKEEVRVALRDEFKATLDEAMNARHVGFMAKFSQPPSPPSPS